MADYWKSNPKKYCGVCKCWIQDNFVSVNNHESGQRHINNVQKKLNELRRNAKSSSEGKMREKISLINDMAFVGMMKDIEHDPSLAKRYGVDLSGLWFVCLITLLDEQLDSMKQKLKGIQKKKEEKNKKKNKNKPTPAVVPLPHTAPKPFVYEWKEVKTSDGKIYYWNKKTGATQWERPQASIQSANDSECVSHEKKRLDQFLFNRLVELSESGSSEASAAVCQAFGASTDKSRSPSPPPDVMSHVINRATVAADEQANADPSESKRPRINLLGEWQPVIPDEQPPQAAAAVEEVSNHEEAKPVKTENKIKLRITSLASKAFRGDEAKLQEITEKAELLSRLSEISEASLSSAQRLEFKEKQASVSSAAKKAVQKLESCLKPDPDAADAPATSLPPPITFKRKSNAGRNFRNRTNDD
ncbi:unnamed protein product [Mesocestoides corti]|uniref:WW domain-containing protein n=1 Tax=Mesocestoides corti TaxID=53468 RepID=A0A0R3U6A0_MESCO|nr:unnamed protein product [Mesocestoides corti]